MVLRSSLAYHNPDEPSPRSLPPVLSCFSCMLLIQISRVSSVDFQIHAGGEYLEYFQVSRSNLCLATAGANWARHDSADVPGGV
ncbi:hypothetical protein OBBRIDRAFT_216493 [Obba rivulosa]|uniref:Uncharacterized protein n=1 Tax=Obba rivulosa TaxID=1052685 RepID=A0A8E2J3P6_9APHY|nr:hypothetical protein OBBRIDRAFT_216493 [Obba rivulosa]